MQAEWKDKKKSNSINCRYVKLFIFLLYYTYIYRYVYSNSQNVVDNFGCFVHHWCRHRHHLHRHQEKKGRGETEPNQVATESNGRFVNFVIIRIQELLKL